ncbi:MAG: pyruvate formate lyase family protein [Kiritimatiellae bacterium]|nr:pyruvate formate lyase family protein [Kiritimatiellia bacterium]
MKAKPIDKSQTLNIPVLASFARTSGDNALVAPRMRAPYGGHLVYYKDTSIFDDRCDTALAPSWTIFAPIQYATCEDALKDSLPEEISLVSIPDSIKLHGNTLPAITIPAQPFLDLESYLTKTLADSALIYIAFTTEHEGIVTFGFGADWWYQAWIDEAPVSSTIPKGNILWPISCTDNLCPVNVSKGRHMLVMRFIGGLSSSVLCVAGPKEMMAGAKCRAAPIKKEILRDNFRLSNASKRRLSKHAHTLTKRGLSGTWFAHMVTMREMGISPAEGTENISASKRDAFAIRRIAEYTPLRIDPEELIVGSALQFESIQARPPFIGESGGFGHTTLDFQTVRSKGYHGVRDNILANIAAVENDGKRDFWESMLICIGAACRWHDRYRELLGKLVEESSGDQKRHYQKVLRNCKRVPEYPSENFTEAVQALWFQREFLRVCGCWSGIGRSGIGRIDELLGDFLKKDLKESRITIAEAREILSHFFAKGTEWVGPPLALDSGDAAFFQYIILAGVDKDGKEVCNEVTCLVLDIIEELHISDFPVTVRVNSRTPARLYQRIAEVQSLGSGIVAVYNED